MIHEIVEIFHHYLLQHIQVSDQDVGLLSNIEPVILCKRSTSNTQCHQNPSVLIVLTVGS